MIIWPRVFTTRGLFIYSDILNIVKRKNYISGFTLIEMIISITIILIITSVIMLSQRNFSETVELINVSERIASVIREAQVKGLAVEILNEDIPEAGRGVYFDGSDEYVYFSDENNNQQYDIGEEITNHLVRPGFMISEMSCGFPCDDLSIVYQRPETQAYFYSEGSELGSDVVSLTILSDNGREKIIKIFRTGQISVTDQ